MTIEDATVDRLRLIVRERAVDMLAEPGREDLRARYHRAVNRVLRVVAARSAAGLLVLALVGCAPLDERIGASDPTVAVEPLAVAVLTDSARGDVERGLALWAAGGCDVRVRLVDPADAAVTIELTEQSPGGHLGLTTDGVPTRIEIYRWTSGLAGVVAHELGHAVGAGHVDDSASVMSPGAWWIQGDRVPSVSDADRVVMGETGVGCVGLRARSGQ